MTPADVLREAAKGITAENWCQGRLHDYGRSCALGHIGRVAGDDFATFGAASAALRRSLRNSVSRWNDSKRRRHTDVIALFNRVADELEAAR